MRKRLSAWIATPGNGIGFTISVVVLFGVAAGIIGLIRNIGFLRDIAPEFIGIGFTVLVLDALNRLRLSQQERIRVATQMASESNAFALEAVRLARHYGWLHDGSFRRIDLKGANLENADLASADLAGCSLVGANLFRANFGSWRMTETLKGKIVAWGESGDKPTNLHGSLLAGVNLEQAILVDADFSDCNLLMANLRKVRAKGANFSGSNLVNADMTDAILENCNMSGVKCNNNTVWPEGFELPDDTINVDDFIRHIAELENSEALKAIKLARAQGMVTKYHSFYLAQIPNANLKGADLSEGNLARVNLSGSDLRMANLENCDLKQADLAGADLHGANLCNAQLQGANLSVVGLDTARLRGAVYDETTIWPAEFVPDRAGAKRA